MAFSVASRGENLLGLSTVEFSSISNPKLLRYDKIELLNEEFLTVFFVNGLLLDNDCADILKEFPSLCI